MKIYKFQHPTTKEFKEEQAENYSEVKIPVGYSLFSISKMVLVGSFI